MTPAQRVRRVQRWITKSTGTEFSGLPTCVATHDIRDLDCHCFDAQGYLCKCCERIVSEQSRRLELANRLFAAELAWLTEYALHMPGAARIDCLLDAVSGPIVSEPTFVCGNCQRDVPLSQSTDGRLPYLCDECICYEAGSTIQAERTCSGCMHHVTPSKHFEGSKRCELKRVYFDDCALACPQFNAPSGLQWEYGVATGSWWLCRSEVTIGRVIDRTYSESGQHEAHTKSDVIATGTLHDCARALVDRVKGDR